MKLNLVSTTPPRWFLFDDFGNELAQRADVDFYDTAVITTPKGKSVVNTLLKMEAERLGTEPSEEQKRAGIKVTVVKVEPHEHEDYLRSMPVHDHEPVAHDHEEYAHGHEGYATTKSLESLQVSLEESEMGEVVAREAINRRLDKHESVHSYAPVRHEHDALLQRIENLEKLVKALTESVTYHEHTGNAAIGHQHDEIALQGQRLQQVRYDLEATDAKFGSVDQKLGAVESKVDTLAAHPKWALAEDLEKLAGEQQDQIGQVVSFKDVGGGKRRFTVDVQEKGD